MKKFLLVCFCLHFAFTIWAQEKMVTGKVTSAEDGSTLPGVNVVVKGTTIGTVTDSNGGYSISVPSSNGTLVFSFIGLQSKEIDIGNQSTIDLSMVSDVTQLSEVVVVGYGTQERSKLSSSLSSISGNSISGLATPSFDTQLGGRAAGVQVTLGTGIIGSTPTINIRGVNSITSGTFPLVVIDNVPMITGNQSLATPTNPLADINPSDIESFQILKDGAATAIYGSRAANGVILITTKRGSKSKGKLSVDFTASTGWSEAGKKFDLLNADEFISVANQKLASVGVAPAAFKDANDTRTDWQDVILRKGAFSNYNLNFSGATDKTNYFFSMGYQSQQGATVNNSFDRLSFRTNLDHKLNKFLEVGTGISVTRSTTDGLNTGANALSGNIAGAVRLFPNVPVYDSNNPTGYNLSTDFAVLGSGANTRQIDNNYTNLGFVLANNIQRATTDRIISSFYGKVNIIDGLSLKTQYSIDYLSNRDFISRDPRHGDGRSVNGLVFSQLNQVTRWNWQNLLNFNRDFGDHGIDVVGGLEFQKTTFSFFNSTGQNFSDRFFQQNELITGTYATQLSGGGFDRNGFSSYFGRINYTFRDRYLFGISARNDGLSNLPQATRRGNFFGGSIGYRISEENFFKNSGITKVINDLKLRASYAEVGNVNIGLFPYSGLYGSAQYGLQNGIGFSQAGNPDLRWETSKKFNIGADVAFLNNKINLIVDYFTNDIDGNILNAPTPPSIGVPNNSISKNVGLVSNSGLELTVSTTPINKKGFVWNVNANMTFVKNEVKALVKNASGVDQPIIGPTDFNGRNFPYAIVKVGESINSIYGFQYAGVNASNGNPMYYKGNGSVVQRNGLSGSYSFYDPANPTNETNVTGAALSPNDVSQGGDRRVLGNTAPKWFGGLTNTFSYKAFSLEVFIRFQGGNKVYNQTLQDNLLNQDFTNSGKAILNSWTTENPNTDIPKMYLNRNNQVNQQGSAISRFVENGDFLRIQNISLSYNLPKSILEKTGEFKISSVRIFAQVQNAFTLTNYKGIDPELGIGFDNNANPIFRTYTFGINIGL